MKQPLNIALLGRNLHWAGGAELLRVLANALLFVADHHQLRLFLLVPVRNKIDNFTDLRRNIRNTAASLIKHGTFSLPKREPVFGSIFHDYFRNLDGIVQPVEYNEQAGPIPALRRIEADVVMPAAASLGPSFPFPWVGYIYDLQHKYFPDYFSARECLDRDIHFATMLRDAKAVIVTSKSVKDDIDKFFPKRECEVFNLPFSAAPVSTWLEDGNADLLARYKLPSRYFLSSNQFWIHKSHITAFRALAMLMNDHGCADLHLVCTGKMEDYRFPDYIEGLRQQVRDLGIEGNVHFLGHIPKIDQIGIMKGCLAVLQPTLFEGNPGGLSVYDAVSLGIPVILSDIPVNREIEEEGNLFYFEAGSVTDLAGKITGFLKKSASRPSKQELVSRGERRKELMGERIMEVVYYAMGKSHRA
jgi:glycosyltransferase involved in cell wall biosynthesis